MDKVTYRISKFLKCVHFVIDHGKDKKASYVGELWFQSGSIKKYGINGVQVRDIIDMLVNHLKDLDSKHPSSHNQETIKYLLLAQLEQDKQIHDKEKQEEKEKAKHND